MKLLIRILVTGPSVVNCKFHDGRHVADLQQH
jgi:hypothetical protein